MFVAAMRRNICSVSVTFPLSSKYLDDSGVNLKELSRKKFNGKLRIKVCKDTLFKKGKIENVYPV